MEHAQNARSRVTKKTAMTKTTARFFKHFSLYISTNNRIHIQHYLQRLAVCVLCYHVVPRLISVLLLWKNSVKPNQTVVGSAARRVISISFHKFFWKTLEINTNNLMSREARNQMWQLRIEHLMWRSRGMYFRAAGRKKVMHQDTQHEVKSWQRGFFELAEPKKTQRSLLMLRHGKTKNWWYQGWRTVWN